MYDTIVTKLGDEVIAIPVFSEPMPGDTYRHRVATRGDALLVSYHFSGAPVHIGHDQTGWFVHTGIKHNHTHTE